MSKQCCANCDAYLVNTDVKLKPGQEPVGWCRANPPLYREVMMQVQSLDPRAPQMMPMAQSVFPPVPESWWCRSWKPVWEKNARIIDGSVHDEPANKQPA